MAAPPVYRPTAENPFRKGIYEYEKVDALAPVSLSDPIQPGVGAPEHTPEEGVAGVTGVTGQPAPEPINFSGLDEAEAYRARGQEGAGEVMEPGFGGSMPYPEQGDAALGNQRGAPEQPGMPDPGQKEAAQKPGKLDAFHAYMSEQLADAGFRKSGSDKKAGFVAQSGRFKGMTQDEINGMLRKEFGGFGADQRAKYAGMASGDDVATDGGGDLVARPGGREPSVGDASFGGLDEGERYRGQNRDIRPGRDRPLDALEKTEEAGANKLLEEMRSPSSILSPTTGRPEFRSQREAMDSEGRPKYNIDPDRLKAVGGAEKEKFPGR
tara:strand:- start:191 stop:1162 length:972 start_codon:yes stop_codon:yes gene_type:complete